MNNILNYASLVLVMAGMTACTSGNNKTTESETDDQTTENALVWVKDNPDDKKMPTSLFPTASDSLIHELGLEEGVPSSISTFLLHDEGEWILFDTGLGAAHGGQMLQGLANLGLTPDSINYVYLTHFHGDHIGGMLQDGERVFANAQVYAGQTEYDAWINEMPAEQTAQQHAVMDAYKDQLHLFQFGETLPHHVVALDAVGHTPGHTAFETGNTLVIGDLMHGAALQMAHPEISGNYDMDKEKAAESRARLINYAKEKGLVMAGMHLPEPGFIE